MSAGNTEIQGVIFDLDGTIVDTEGTAQSVIEEALLAWGLKLDVSHRGLVSGRTWAAGFDILFERYAVPVPRAEAEHEILARYRAATSRELLVIPGVVKAIRALAGTYPLALVSGSHRREILFALDRLKVRDLFTHIFGAEDYPRSKPAPDGFLKAIEALKVSPSQCLVFEDSAAGIAGARAAGLQVVAVTHANPFGESHSAAHSSIANFEGVDVEWVRRL